MPSIDWPLDQLQQYKPALTRAADFADFWQTTLSEARRAALDPRLEGVDYPIREVSVYRASWTGLRNRVIAWYLTPPHANGKLPAIIFYHGYSGSKEPPYAYMQWVIQGYAVLAVDVRRQSGESSDTTPYSTGHYRGWMTKGVLNKDEYFYRGAYVDCMRAIDFLATRDEIDMSFVALTGASQGGALTMSTAALDDRPVAAMPDVPFLCDFPRSLEITPNGPYPELVDFIKKYPQHHDRVMQTLSYFDLVNHAPNLKCPTLMSIGLWDDICAPSTCFAAYNHLTCEREVAAYPFVKHEVLPPHHERKMRWLRERRDAHRR